MLQISSAQHWGWKGAHFSDTKGVKSVSKKIAENSRQMAPVLTICDEYDRIFPSECGLHGARIFLPVR